MKTTVDIPDAELNDVVKFSRAKTKRDAIVTAITDFNRRRRMAALVRHSGIDGIDGERADISVGEAAAAPGIASSLSRA